jgi:glycosyltransferase involved in cell wall biosynthesis
MKNKEYLINLISGKSVLFITTREISYIRCHQEIQLISQFSREFQILGTYKNIYLTNIVYLYLHLFLLIFKKKPDVIFVSFLAQPLLPWLIFRFFSPKSIIITDFFISLYETLVQERCKIRERTILSKVLFYFDKITCTSSDLIIFDTKSDLLYFTSLFNVPKKKTLVLYLEANKNIYFPQEVIKSDELFNNYVVLYFGSILPLQGVDIILNAAKLLANVNEIKFILIGPIKNKIQSPNIIYIPWLPEDELATQIAMADLCLAGHFNNTIDKAKRTIAGKTFIYQQMGKKIILGDNPANKELFPEDNRKFHYVIMGDSLALATKIHGLFLSRNRELNNEKN